MAEGLMAVGIILVIVWFFARRNFNYKPGSKNWAINAEERGVMIESGVWRG